MAHSGHFRTSSSGELLPPQASLLLIPLVVWAASSGHTLSGLLLHTWESTKASPLPAFRFLSVRYSCYSYQRRRECEHTSEHQESLKQTCSEPSSVACQLARIAITLKTPTAWWVEGPVVRTEELLALAKSYLSKHSPTHSGSTAAGCHAAATAACIRR